MPEHKLLFQQFVERVFHQGEVGALDRYFTSDAIIEDPGIVLHGPRALQPALRGLLAAFPDLRITIEDAIQEGDRLAIRYRGEGTHRGEWRGIPAVGTRIRYTGMLMVRYEGDRIAEYRAQPDLLGLLQQLGAVQMVQVPLGAAVSAGA